MGPIIQIGHLTVDGKKEFTSNVPQFGLGTFLMSEPGECFQAVLTALELGYRHIDTAMAYENEHEVGEAIAEAISRGIITRDELFVTTKLRQPHALGFEAAMQRCQESLKNLKLEFIDLYLVHAPPKNQEHRAPTWKGMEECLRNGWTKAIGVSNYGAHHLDKMRSYAKLLPAVNQIEVHPWLQRTALRAATESIGATVMAYSPLARGHKVDDPKLAKIASDIGCTPAQLAIKWCLDNGCITVPKSSNASRIEENLSSLEVKLEGHLDLFRELEENYISGWDPTSEA